MKQNSLPRQSRLLGLCLTLAACAGLALTAVPRASAQDLYLSDFDNSQVLEYTQAGTLVRTFSSGGLFVSPDALAFSGGSLFVSAQNSSTGDGSVYQYDLNNPTAAPTVFAVDPGGVLSGLAFGGGNLYAADSSQGQILEYSAATGALQATFGTGTSPLGLAFQGGSLYAGDSAAGSIVKYSAAGVSQGVFVAAGSGGLQSPGDFSFDASGALYVASEQGTSSGFVARFDTNGSPDPSAGNTGAVFASDPGLLNPYGVAVGPTGAVFVGDRNSNLSNGSGGGGHFDQFSTGGGFVRSNPFSGGNGNPYGLAFGPAAPAAVPEASTTVSLGLLLALMGSAALVRLVLNRRTGGAFLRRSCPALLMGGLAALLPASAQGPNPLVTGRSITVPNTAFRQAVGSLPMNMILAPGGRYAIVTGMGYRQSLWSVNTTTGRGVAHLDFPNGGMTDPAKTNGLYFGLAAAPNGDGTSTLYAAQGNNATIAKIIIGADGSLTMAGSIMLAPGQFAAGVALNGRGYLYVAINENYTPGTPFDPTAFLKPSSLAVYSTASGLLTGTYTFNELAFPNAAYPGIPGFVPPIAAGMATPPSFPLAVAALSDGSKVFVGSQRDGKVYVLNASVPGSPALLTTIPTGAHPVALLLNQAQTRLYVANASSDTVSVVDTGSGAILDTVLLRPTAASTLAGATPTGLALSPDEKTLYTTLGDMSAVAVVSVGSLPSSVTGMIPTGWYPTAIAVNPANNRLLVANAKGTQTRNPNDTAQGPGGANGTYILNIIEGNVLTFPLPNTALLAADTQQVLNNNSIPALGSPNPLTGIGLSAGKIKHVVYIIKENRTYDQVLGDLPQGNGDPALTLFGSGPGAHVTPNFHALASRFVLLDNFYDCSEASGDGWPWSTGSFANEYVIKNLPYNYSGRGRNYDFEGSDNFFLTGGFPATDPNGQILSALFPTGAPAIPDVGAAPAGHIWDDVVANVKLTGTGLSVPYRNYGFFYSLVFPTAGGIKPPLLPVPDNYPAVTGVQPPGHDLAGVSDYDFREFDLTYPDSDAPAIDGVAANYKTLSYSNYLPTAGKTAAPSRFEEFKKEFNEMVPPGTTDDSRVPAFLTVRFMSDHTDGTTAGDPSPRAHVADNDYGVGQFVDLISHSSIWNNTAIFVIEDDAQDGQDHVDAHRSTCYIISPYIKANSVDHTFYNTDSVLKTMEQLLGVPPLSQYDATAHTILDWDTSPTNAAPYTAVLPDAAIIGEMNPSMKALVPGTEAYRLATLAAGMDFKHPDSADPTVLNEMIWKSVKGMNSAVPVPRHALKTPAAPAASRDGDD